jgi:hypothetical protein
MINMMALRSTWTKIPLNAICSFMCLALLLRPSHAFTPISVSRNMISTSSNLNVRLPPVLRSAPSIRTSRNHQQARLHLAISYESLMEKIPPQAVIKAVENSPDGKVVASGKRSYAGAERSVKLRHWF